MYGTLYINPLLKIDLDPGHVRKPSKRKEGVDPLLPITPARFPRTIPVPVAPVSFSSRCIQGSQNRAAATILFTPRSHANTTKQHRGPLPANQFPPLSPTPQRGQSPLKSVLALSSNNNSDTEDEVRKELEKLDLQSQSGSQS